MLLPAEDRVFDRRKISVVEELNPKKKKFNNVTVDAEKFMGEKFEETKLVGIASSLQKLKSQAMLKSAYNVYNKDNEKEAVIKDYLFPEIRAKYDRSVPLKNAGLNAISV